MLTLEKFEEASEIVKKVTLETKLVYSDYFSAQTGNRVYLKPENLQFTGAYKLRGAYYRSASFPRRKRRAAWWRRRPATMPRAWLMRQNAMEARQPS